MNLKDLSIKRKLMLITMLTSGVAVVLSSAGFLIYDLTSFRHSLSQDLMTQAEIIGYNSAAAMAIVLMRMVSSLGIFRLCGFWR